ncbi:IPExxxVDY family protein [Lacinutrix salivirga]
MSVHRMLLEDCIEQEEFTLVGIHTTIEDYKLAYLLNKNLEVNLKRLDNDLDFFNKAHYSIFEWEDNKQLVTWNLVSNSCRLDNIDVLEDKTSLFQLEQSTSKTFYLLPEYKKVSYLLKISTQYNVSKQKQILDTIIKIPQVATAYSIDTNTLKNKDHLIFD